MRILLDMDDVLEELLPAWCDVLNSRYGTSVNPDSITKWDMTENFPSLSAKEIYNPLLEPDFWDCVKPAPGAVDSVKKLQEQGHDVYVVTASHLRTIAPKMERVLFRHFPTLTWDHVVVTQNKQLLHGDILVDDAPHNLVGGMYMGFLYSRPHNRLYDAPANGLYRVESWDDIMCAVEYISHYRR